MQPKKAPTIYNKTLTVADTEYTQALTGAKWFEFQCRTSAEVRFAFVTGKVAAPTAPYMTLKAGQTYDSGELYDNLTLYLASATAGAVVEIIAWS